jgi:hypothetical protein
MLIGKHVRLVDFEPSFACRLNARNVRGKLLAHAGPDSADAVHGCRARHWIGSSNG